MARTFGWLEVELIAELLLEEHPAMDPQSTSFTTLKRLVMDLADFQEESGHPCNEKILETIQANWIQDRQGRIPEED